ncbi:adp-ribosylation factor-related protein 1 [Limosa lapponica baueri]|uniref:Adp-ribosylation factor-related protein 1 n=1 Tax=Limosa lapponica baueri TaxID=1758121 RepID=A0A2I0TP05_LIMLA|nr:adp-ribosylation factor-related protein 1 [Limosa lapponica baueri]
MVLADDTLISVLSFQYYAESHGVIYVIDSTDEERLSESKRAFEKMITSEALEGVPILVLANKQDVETCLSIPDIKTAFSDCINKIGKRDCLTQACSALTGKGVNEGIEWMVKCVVRNIHRPPRKKDITWTQLLPAVPGCEERAASHSCGFTPALGIARQPGEAGNYLVKASSLEVSILPLNGCQAKCLEELIPASDPAQPEDWYSFIARNSSACSQKSNNLIPSHL